MANTRQYKPLITAGEVIEKCFTNQNTDTALISDNTVVLAELAHLRVSLGEDFYNELKLQNDGGTLSTENQTFIDYYLLDALAWFVRFEVATDLQNNTTSSGVVRNVDDFSKLINAKDFNAFKQDTYRKASIFLKDMVDFLNHKDQDGDYPTYSGNKPCNNDSWKNHGIIMY